MAYQLVIVKGRSSNEAVLISSEAALTIGRQDGCQLRIVSSQVSRKHCELRSQDGKLFVKDLQSSNGTFVDGLKIEDETEVQAGQLLTIGNVVFRIEEAQAGRPSETGAKPHNSAVAQAASPAGEHADYEIEADDSTTLPPAPRKPPVSKAPSPPTVTSAETSDDELIELSEDVVIDFLSEMDPDSKK